MPDTPPPFTAVEARYEKRKRLPAGRRLACQAELLGDVVVDVPPDSQVHKQVVRKRAEVRAIELDPVVRLHYVEVEEPDMHAPLGDLERLQQALAEQWELRDLTCDLRSLQRLQKTLRQGEWKITVAVRIRPTEIIGVWPGFHDRAFGLAVDVGSTTIAAHLCDLSTGEVLASAGHDEPADPLRRGPDEPGQLCDDEPGRRACEMTARRARRRSNTLAGQVAAAPDRARDILEMTCRRQPVMHHLLLGIDPTELGGAPFALATDSPMTL